MASTAMPTGYFIAHFLDAARRTNAGINYGSTGRPNITAIHIDAVYGQFSNAGNLSFSGLISNPAIKHGFTTGKKHTRAMRR